MNLPELPKKYNRREAKIDGKVNAWFMKNHPRSYLLEVKMKGGRVQPHQEAALKMVEKDKFSYKFPDGRQRTPADYVGLKNADAILCICEDLTCVCDINSIYQVTIKV